MNTQGKFFVIDGIDGSGKGIQMKMLIERLLKEGLDIAVYDFPQYGKKSCALVEEFQNGKYGNVNDVSAYQASIFYAVDRFDASFRMKKDLEDEKIIISNRYVSSKQIHQSGKISDEKELKKFLTWLDDLEYGIFKIPVPDKVIFLNMPFEYAIKFARSKQTLSFVETGKVDITEKGEQSEEYQRKSYKQATNLLKRYPNWIEVRSVNDSGLRTIEDINEEIYQILKREILKIQIL